MTEDVREGGPGSADSKAELWLEPQTLELRKGFVCLQYVYSPAADQHIDLGQDTDWRVISMIEGDWEEQIRSWTSDPSVLRIDGRPPKTYHGEERELIATLEHADGSWRLDFPDAELLARELFRHGYEWETLERCVALLEQSARAVSSNPELLEGYPQVSPAIIQGTTKALAELTRYLMLGDEEVERLGELMNPWTRLFLRARFGSSEEPGPERWFALRLSGTSTAKLWTEPQEYMLFGDWGLWEAVYSPAAHEFFAFRRGRESPEEALEGWEEFIADAAHERVRHKGNPEELDLDTYPFATVAKGDDGWRISFFDTESWLSDRLKRTPEDQLGEVCAAILAQTPTKAVARALLTHPALSGSRTGDDAPRDPVSDLVAAFLDAHPETGAKVIREIAQGLLKDPGQEARQAALRLIPHLGSREADSPAPFPSKPSKGSPSTKRIGR